VIRLAGACVDLGGRRVLDEVDLAVERGAWVAVIGPNGAGKTTLLRLLAGLVTGAGELELDGRPAATLTRRARAVLVALVPQVPIVPPGVAVTDYVLLGRNPHIALLGRESAADLAAVREALARLDLLGFAGRAVTTLSGGERQRVLIARALAQGGPILLLDEPTTALDVGHGQQVLELVDELRRDRDLTVVATMHDLTLAAQYADRLALLVGGRVVGEGPPAAVLTEQNLARHYDARVRIVHNGDGVTVTPIRSARDDAGGSHHPPAPGPAPQGRVGGVGQHR
jgi:iron complex transport system ATP-binding protein